MEPKKLYRSRSNKVIGGVAAGMANYLNLDPTVLRVVWVIALFLSAGFAALAYLVLLLIIPEVPEASDRKKVKNDKS